ncbi:hypothetical protein RO3G_08595 [Rhizopus delemar RA 99-880]|uniref:Carboxymuconolactone decarboxylase-like domain-containing protein n=1 Tax=Rhizopus delemar (strain RA 99-880 / ATCC MYA-4621 / FGSC 9543 / NRRL 43880) TaxID=246409 RepID=I1C610_RHIO9|nr:hypothetical protein RO3G_08595 [Rhizopus delemar RA 99-880]|eukprot:EIE83890.1 hypothetical protein RO3G_08595 [Rhizopus delemar RA 99-880]
MSVKNILLRALEQGSDISKDTWYIASVSVMASVNHPEDVRDVYDVISNHINQMQGKSQSVKNDLMSKIVLRMREAALKSHVIIGFPKTINVLQHLADVTPDTIKSLLPKKPLSRHTEKVIKNMYSTHPDLAQTALHHLYGPILSDISVLNPKETSLVVVAGLMAENIPLQLKGHRYGAIHNGATEQEIRKVESLVSELADHYKIPIDS